LQDTGSKVSNRVRRPLALSAGKRAQAGLVAAIAFHVALLPFGWGFYVWSIPMIGALTLLLRAQGQPVPEPVAVEGPAPAARAA
jgi:hypothetical protein